MPWFALPVGVLSFVVTKIRETVEQKILDTFAAVWLVTDIMVLGWLSCLQNFGGMRFPIGIIARRPDIMFRRAVPVVR